MSDVKLGHILDEDEKRDAIHVAIAPVVAAASLRPGEHVGLNAAGEASAGATPIGIVDPFLKRPVEAGQRFYLCLYQNTVTGMRHHWFHPDFATTDTPADLESHKAFIRHEADRAGISYEEIMEGAEDYLRHGDYLSQGGRWEGFGIPDSFWDHYEAIKGVKVPDSDRGSFFSCSC